jgi:hypothetical protein
MFVQKSNTRWRLVVEEGKAAPTGRQAVMKYPIIRKCK